jgi:hypothetical protein
MYSTYIIKHATTLYFNSHRVVSKILFTVVFNKRKFSAYYHRKMAALKVSTSICFFVPVGSQNHATNPEAEFHSAMKVPT